MQKKTDQLSPLQSGFSINMSATSAPLPRKLAVEGSPNKEKEGIH